MGWKQHSIQNMAIVLVLIAVFCCSCSNDIAEVASLTNKQNMPDETSMDMHLLMSTNGLLNYEFVFKRLDHYIFPEKYYETPEGLIIVAYDDFGEKNVTLTADYGVNYEDKKLMEAKRNVVITNHKNGEIIESEHMIWDMTTHRIYSKGQIKQTKPDGSVYVGEAFESDENMEKYELINPKIIFYTED